MRKVCQLDSCGIEFDATREDARFHSAVCRAKASRERRAGEGPDSGPSGLDEDPVGPQDDADRLSALEVRVADLQADVEAVEENDERVRDRAKRIAGQEAAVRRAVQELVAPIVREVAALKASVIKREELTEAFDAIEHLNARMSHFDAAPVPVGDRKLGEVERAVITLASRVRRLRHDFDQLVGAINSE